jgi:hypothetical protein
MQSKRRKKKKQPPHKLLKKQKMMNIIRTMEVRAIQGKKKHPNQNQLLKKKKKKMTMMQILKARLGQLSQSAAAAKKNKNKSLFLYTHPISGSETSNAGGEMDDIATRVIDATPLEKEATTPQAESTDTVRESEPQGDEEHPGNEIHTTQKGASQEDERDGSENELEVDHGSHGIERSCHRYVYRLCCRQHCLRLHSLVSPNRSRFAPERNQLLPERHLVGPYHPTDQNRRKRIERHECRVDCPFLLHYAAVEDHQPWH